MGGRLDLKKEGSKRVWEVATMTDTEGGGWQPLVTEKTFPELCKEKQRRNKKVLRGVPKEEVARRGDTQSGGGRVD